MHNIYIIKKINNIKIKNILTQYPVQIRSLGTFLMGGEPLTRPRRVYCVSGRDLKNKYLYIQKINIYIYSSINCIGITFNFCLIFLSTSKVYVFRYHISIYIYIFFFTLSCSHWPIPGLLWSFLWVLRHLALVNGLYRLTRALLIVGMWELRSLYGR